MNDYQDKPESLSIKTLIIDTLSTSITIAFAVLLYQEVIPFLK